MAKRKAPAAAAGDVVFHLSRGPGGLSAKLGPDLPDLRIPWDGSSTWAGVVLWDAPPMPEGRIEATVELTKMTPEILEVEGYFGEVNPEPAGSGLSVLRTSDLRGAFARPRVVLPKGSLDQWFEGPEPSFLPDLVLPPPKKPKLLPDLIPARASKSSAWWNRYKARMRACGTPKVGRIIYGSNGAQECLRSAKCNLASCGCRGNDVARRVRLIGPRGLMTLTFKQEGGPITRDEAWILAFRLMRWLFIWFRRRGLPLGRYVAVKECHKTGWVHVHIVTEYFPHELAVLKRRKRKDGSIETYCAIDQVPATAEDLAEVLAGRVPFRDPKSGEYSVETMRWRDEWVRLGGGFIVSWEELKNDGAYIAKYVDKACNWPEDIKALVARHDARAFTSSTGLKAKKKPSDWVYASGGTMQAVEADLRMRQWRTTRPDEGEQNRAKLRTS